MGAKSRLVIFALNPIKMKTMINYCKSIMAVIALLATGCDRNETNLPVNTAPIPRILEFSPANATPGSIVTIKGANFSSDVKKNEVKFNQMIVPIESASESEIQVKIPELDVKQVGISVRSNGKISNKKILSLVKIRKFEDRFERPDFGPVGPSANPNPFGEDWTITQGRFSLTGGKVTAKEAGIEALMFFEQEGLDLVTGDGNYFKMTVDTQGSEGSFSGIVFNAQSDRKRFYLLRMNGGFVQFLKTGPAGLNDWARVVFSEGIPGFEAGVPLRIEISSSSPGQFLFKVTNLASNTQIMDRTVTDENPYSGGIPGFYFLGLTPPVNIWFDNLTVELL